MASHTVAAGKVGAHAKTLVASTVDTVTFNSADDLRQVEVSSDGAAAIYFTVDGSTPAVADAGCYHLPALPSSKTVRVPDADPTVVKLISAGAPVYHVERA